MFDDKIEDDHVINEIYNSNFKDLSEGVTAGYTSSYDLKDATMVLQLQNNIASFAAFKTYRQTSEMKLALTTPEGKKKPWNEFLKEAKAIDDKYRVNWLRAEYDMAIKQGRAADNWMQFERDKDVYPNLEYMPSSSAEPNQDHVKYYGLIYPIDHPFWDNGLPPLKWGCKCSVKQTRSTNVSKSVENPVPVKGVAGNAGKLGMVFTPNHPYVDNVSKITKAAIKQQLYDLKKGFDNEFYTIPGEKGSIKISFNSDIEDLPQNFSSAKLIADNFKAKIQILPHYEEQKNPEFKFSGSIGDKTIIRTKNISSYIDNTFKNKLGKKGQLRDFEKSFILFDFNSSLTDDNIHSVAAKLNSRLKNPKGLQFIMIQNDNKIVKINKSKFNYSDILDITQKDLL